MKDKRRVLALSSSKVGSSGYLEKAMPQIREFLGEKPLKIALVPFAYVDTFLLDHFKSMVDDAFTNTPYTIRLVSDDDSSFIEEADVIMVNGGNTFKLLHDLYKSGLVEVIRRKVNEGVPYIGWSAGSNITGATICTTNDMPIIEPESFRAFGFFPFQINPHYYNVAIPGFNGETRDQRLEEFLKLNPGVPVVGLPEGTALLLDNGTLRLIGETAGVLMRLEEGEMKKTPIAVNASLPELMVAAV